jgi:hypothetical protein
VREPEEETGLKVALSDILDLKSGDEDDGYGHMPLQQHSVNPAKHTGKEIRFWAGLGRIVKARKNFYLYSIK